MTNDMKVVRAGDGIEITAFSNVYENAFYLRKDFLELTMNREALAGLVAAAKKVIDWYDSNGDDHAQS